MGFRSAIPNWNSGWFQNKTIVLENCLHLDRFRSKNTALYCIEVFKGGP